MSVRTGTAPRELRSYQQEAVAAVEADWEAGFKRVGVVLPTGAGKSTVIGKLVSNAYHSGHRVVMLAHRAELIDQMIRDLKQVDPGIPDQHIGVVRAEHDDHHAPIVGATLQTLANARRRRLLGKRDVIIWDEVHHSPAVGYHATFRELGGYDDALMCGMTATMYRGSTDKGQSAQIGLGDVIEKISYEKNLRWAIEQGYLVPPTGLTVRINALNALNQIKNVAGDFNQGDLDEIMGAAVQYTVDAIEMHARDRRSIVFATSVAACREIVDLINERGILRAEMTVGLMTYDERKPVYEKFRTGEVDILVTVAVLSEGADFPMCDCVVMARPTRSRVLYSQMVGRALRLYEGKSDALVLDLSGTTRAMKLIHLSELVHGMGLDLTEVDEDGEIIEPDRCAFTDEPVASCMCESCVAARTVEVKEAKGLREGPVDMTPIDLLAEGTDTVWLETPAGVPFINLDRSLFVFVWPKDGVRADWTVGYINTRTRQGAYTALADDGEPLYYSLATALRKAEEWAMTNNYELPSRTANWRTKNQAPSDKQLDYARSLGIAAYDRMTRGRLSDEISIAVLAGFIDDNVDPKQDEAS
jgi:superfamily II DNA or RNA helicase